MAMLNVYQALGDKKDIKMTLQIHDELLFEVDTPMLEHHTKGSTLTDGERYESGYVVESGCGRRIKLGTGTLISTAPLGHYLPNSHHS